MLGHEMKDSSFASYSDREQSQAGSEKGAGKMRLLDRSQLMDMMLFP
jgi:hypothetical protein